MARLDNPFALLDDDDAGDDLSALVAKAEAKISPPPTAAAEQPKPKGAPGAFPSKPLPPSDYAREERGRERGGRGRGTGRLGYGSGAADGDGGGRYGNGYSRGYGYNSNGRGRGGRGGWGRGRARGFYEEQGPLDNQGQVGDALNEKQEAISPPNYENGKSGEENNGRGRWEDRGYGYGGEHRRYRNGEGYDGRSYYGGENRGFRGGEGRRYGPRDGSGRRNGGYGYENKGESVGENEKAGDAAANGETENVGAAGDNASSGREVPEITDAPKDVEPGQSNPQPVDSEDASGKKTAEQLEEEEEAKKMTLAEYEKLFQEKRKALVAFKSEERKVVVDKQFDGMQVIEKKKEDELSLKQKSEKDKMKKKDVLEKEEKTRKSVNINEFLKPAGGETYRGRGRGRGGYRGGYSGRGRSVFVPSIDDAAQFPALGQNTATKVEPFAKA